MDGFVGDRVKLRIDNLWPSLLPGDEQLDSYKLQKVLVDSQWLERNEMADYQFDHLKNLVKFAAREVPFWRSRVAPDVAGANPTCITANGSAAGRTSACVSMGNWRCATRRSCPSSIASRWSRKSHRRCRACSI